MAEVLILSVRESHLDPVQVFALRIRRLGTGLIPVCADAVPDARAGLRSRLTAVALLILSILLTQRGGRRIGRQRRSVGDRAAETGNDCENEDGHGRVKGHGFLLVGV